MKTNTENTMTTTANTIEKIKTRSTWAAGVKTYALELLENLDGREPTKENLLSGARDWKEYSYGGCALIYDADIAERLATPSELRKTRSGDLPPNRSETWLDCQARALFQAAQMILKTMA